jgi:predicted HTH domain antitoxin
MTDVVSTRLDEKEIEELNKICEKERIDRSSLMRKFLLAQMTEYRLKETGEIYRKGLISLAEAATLSEVSIYAMMDYVEREKIQPKVLTDKEMEEESINAKKLFDNMKK